MKNHIKKLSVEKCVEILSDLKILQNSPNYKPKSIDSKLNQLLTNVNFEESKSKKIDLMTEIIVNKLLNRETAADLNPKHLLFNEIRATQSSTSTDSAHIVGHVCEIDAAFQA